MNNLYRFFPKEIGVPYRLDSKPNTVREFLNVINRYNGFSTVFYSLYNCEIKKNNNCKCNKDVGKAHYCNCKIDKIFFDSDRKGSLEVMKKFLFDNEMKKYKKLIVSKGNKCHIYIFTKNYENITNTKACLRNVHDYIINKLNLKVTGDPVKDDVDFHLLGNIAALVRFPNTLHLLSGRYYIPS